NKKTAPAESVGVHGPSVGEGRTIDHPPDERSSVCCTTTVSGEIHPKSNHPAYLECGTRRVRSVPDFPEWAFGGAALRAGQPEKGVRRDPGGTGAPPQSGTGACRGRRRASRPSITTKNRGTKKIPRKVP